MSLSIRRTVRASLAGGVSALALLAATAAQAQSSDVGVLLKRLDQLEAKVERLEAENKKLSQDLEWKSDRLEKVETRAAKAAQPGVAPTFSDPSGNFTFKIRGVVDVDTVLFQERKGGYDFNDGTAFRRARLGVDGTAFKDFKWRLEADFAGNAVSILDAYLQYAAVKPFVITLGQHKAPYGLEANNSDNFNTFIERGQFTNAFGNVGAERRVGLSAQYIKDNFTFTAGFFGDNESSQRANNAVDESWGVNARTTWAPVNEPGRIIHLGASTYWRTGLKEGNNTKDAIRVNDRPNIRVDNGNIADSGVITGVDNVYYGGVEAAGVWGPVSVVGEYGHLKVDRFAGLSNPSFDGFYVYGSWFLTGESRTFREGNFDRLRPFKDVNIKSGGWGAWELALRYDYLDLEDTPVAARVGNNSESLTLGVNWYLNPHFKLQFNWIRFNGNNTPLDPVGNKTAGDAFATRLHLDW